VHSKRYEVEWSANLEAWVIQDTWLVDEVCVTGNPDDAKTIAECLNIIEFERDGNT